MMEIFKETLDRVIGKHGKSFATLMRHTTRLIDTLPDGITDPLYTILCRQSSLVRQVAQFVLQDLLAQPPQTLAQLHIFGLFRRLCDFAFGYNLYTTG